MDKFDEELIEILPKLSHADREHLLAFVREIERNQQLSLSQSREGERQTE